MDVSFIMSLYACVIVAMVHDRDAFNNEQMCTVNHIDNIIACVEVYDGIAENSFAFEIRLYYIFVWRYLISNVSINEKYGSFKFDSNKKQIVELIRYLYMMKCTWFELVASMHCHASGFSFRMMMCGVVCMHMHIVMSRYVHIRYCCTSNSGTWSIHLYRHTCIDVAYRRV